MLYIATVDVNFCNFIFCHPNENDKSNRVYSYHIVFTLLSMKALI